MQCLGKLQYKKRKEVGLQDHRQEHREASMAKMAHKGRDHKDNNKPNLRPNLKDKFEHPFLGKALLVLGIKELTHGMEYLKYHWINIIL